MITIPAEEALALVHELSQILSDFAKDPGDAAYGPAEGSPALLERSSLPPDLDPVNAYYQAGYLHEVTVDNVFGFSKLLGAPAPSVAPFVCVRGATESSAIASWLADPGIDPLERLARSFAFRKDGLIQQRKLANSSADLELGGIERRIVELEEKFTRLEEINQSRSKPVRLVAKMPSVTNLVRGSLQMEADYRILSSIAHAHLWALQQVSFRVVHEPGGPRLDKWLKPEVIVYLVYISAIALLVPFRMLAKQYAWKAPVISETVARISRLSALKARISAKPGFPHA